MVKFLKPGKVVVVTRGKNAGRKAVIIKTNELGSKARPYGHCLVAGLSKAPRRVKKAMTKKQIAKRSRLKVFLKTVNFAHVMPTRYSYELAYNKLVPKGAAKDPGQKRIALRRLRHRMSADYKKGLKPYFFAKLRF